MFFSVIIPTYNRAHLIEKTIKSLLNQSFENFEIIVVDDGSTDNTEKVVGSIDNRQVKYFKKKNAERASARNFGAQQAKGDYLNFFDSDDLAYPNHLKVAHDFIKSKEVKVFHLAFDIKNENGEEIRKPTPIFDINKQLATGNVLSCNGVFIDRIIALSNPFNEDRLLSASEDYLLWLGIAAQYEICNVNTITSTIVEHGERSVLSIEPNSLIKRKELFLDYLKVDLNILKSYKDSVSALESSTYSYLALHLMMAGFKKEGIRFMAKSIASSFSYVFSKRFLVTIKYIITD